MSEYGPTDRRLPGLPEPSGLYDPQFEHDACGVAFVADINGRRSHDIICDGLEALRNLGHRGATGHEVNTGDGAGALLQVPDRFLRRECASIGIQLPPEGTYGVGTVFLPRDRAGAQWCMEVLEREINRTGLTVLGWRDVPQENHQIGESARAVEPDARQVFVTQSTSHPSLALETRLYLARRRIETAAGGRLYISSLSSRTLIYKGMLTADQLPVYYPDLTDSDLESSLILVHQRFSTNTFPSWQLAHPYRYLAHNGEINTLRGNVNWMRAREQMLQSDLFASEFSDLLPVIQEGGSDSAALDNLLEFLVMTGRSLPHALMMLIPEPWQHHTAMAPERSAFYDYHSSMVEPWDGPAAIAFTDGTIIGALLDRNGLRPGRYYVTKQGRIVLASEVGVLDIPPEDVEAKGRLMPGHLLLVDTAAGRIIPDAEIKAAISSEQPYGAWIETGRTPFDRLPDAPAAAPLSGEPLARMQRAFGFTHEESRVLLAPMALNGEEPVGSMGNDTPLAVLSERPQLLFNYFKQLFAQVTNPPLDAIREELVTSLITLIGPAGNLLRDGGPENCRQIEASSPLLDNRQIARIRAADTAGFDSVVLPMVFDTHAGPDGLSQALEGLFQRASEAIDSGASILLLSDRMVDERHAPIPSLLCTAGLHHHLVRAGTRTRVALIVESGEPREIHHLCILIGYGATAVNPYLALESIAGLVNDGHIASTDAEQATTRYIKALNKGILKVMSKMGISTVDSYRGAQIFEAVGLGQGVISRYFTGTPSRIGGVELDAIALETLSRHAQAFSPSPARFIEIDSEGQYQWRRDGEFHAVNPQMIESLQQATRRADYKLFKEYTGLVNSHSRQIATIRGLMELKRSAAPVPLDEVEPVESILRRFATGAMSFGSISKETHEAVAIAMNRIGGKSNSGEGGEDPERFAPSGDGLLRSSAIKQIASGRFGVTSEYLISAQELQIKMAQGAKPGEGGQLPGDKVDDVIARVRHSTPGVGLISPPPHHDIYSIEDLAQLIFDLKNANDRARVSVKLVAEVGVGTVAAGVAKAHADVVLISGHDGGTGASPLTGMKHAGIPWELGLAEAQQVLVKNNLRDRIIVQTDGQLKTGRDVVMAALLGAEEYGFSTAPLVVLGCVMMRVCHMNTCPVGIATQDPELRKLFRGKPEHLETFFRFIAQDVREHMAALGFRSMDEMIGRTDLLDMNATIKHYKSQGLDLSAILQEPGNMDAPRRRMRPQDHSLDVVLDRRLTRLVGTALNHAQPVSLHLPIRNTDRTVGAILGSEITRRYGSDGLPADTIDITFTGSAGQSFGSFLPPGLTLRLAGDANDYVGKGLSGGTIAVYPPAAATFRRDRNVLLGNVALYGATGGEAYFSGIAGERFAVRNSGARAVVEGVGDHGCEYMTGGIVVVLGHTGRNFAAGMSGGIAFVHDDAGDFANRCNMGQVDIEALDDPLEQATIRQMVERHIELTGSPVAARLLHDWDRSLQSFVKVIPRDYRRVLELQRAEIGAQHA